MKDAIIVSGGRIDDDFVLDFFKKNKKDETILIAADKGLEFFARMRIEPDVALGDFDSLSPDCFDYLNSLPKGKVVRLKPEKDDSDTQSAANYAMDRGCREIKILGATGNRFDHLLANIGLLVHGKSRGTVLSIIDPWNYARIIESGTILKKSGQFGGFVSFFPLDGDVEGLTLKGFKYPLKRYCLKAADSGLTVSNEITEEEAEIEFERGTLLMIMTRD